MATRTQIQDFPEGTPPASSNRGRLICEPWPNLETEVDAWDALAAVAAEPNPFFESWYLLPSLRAFDADAKVSILRFELDGRLCGLMPVVRPLRYYHLPVPNIASWLHANCFLGTPLVAKGAEVQFWQAALDWADRQPGLGLFLHLRDIPLDGPLHAALLGVVAGNARQVEVVHREERALLASNRTPDAYWQAALSGKKRKELRRQLNRLRDEGEVEFHRETGEANLDKWIEDFLVLEAAGWKGKAGSALASSADTTSLFRESLRGAAELGKLERLSITLDGRPVAMLATFLTPPGAYSYKTAFDESYSRFSPGVLLQQENLRLLENDRIAWCDSCAAADHPMIDHIWRERRAIGRLSIAIGGSLRRAAFRHLVRLETSGSGKG